MRQLLQKAASEHGLTIKNIVPKTSGQIFYELEKSKIPFQLWVAENIKILHVMIWNTKARYPIAVFRTNSENLSKVFGKLLESTEYNDNSLPDIYFVESVLKSPALTTNKFAQSLCKQYIERGKLSDKQINCVVTSSNGGSLCAIAMAKDKNLFERYFSITTTAQQKIIEQLHTREFKLKPVDSDSVTLIPTTEHAEYYQYPFPTFNPVQSLVKPHINKDCNIVIGANTSAGKTICAELLMDTTLKQGKKIIYMSPLKSLTQEKWMDWQKRYPDKNIEIMTGDYTITPEKAKALDGVDIICMTSEMLDSRTRKIKSEHNNWLYNVGLLVCDEAHIIGSEHRGHPAEVGIMRFTEHNDNARVIMLSATMPNVEEFGTWLTNLNNKKTEMVFCDWRPVVLNVNYIEYNDKGTYAAVRTKKIEETIRLVMSKPDEKFLVFVHDKTTGKEITKQLKDHGQYAVFHNADLDINSRLNIEAQFKDKNGLRVMVATSTVAWGVNLPARNVVIVGVHRGLNEVDELDLIQEFGRAGRFGIDDAGFVFLLVPEGKTEVWKQRITNPKPVDSGLKKLEVLAFHILGEVHTKNVTNEKSVYDWFDRSLAAIQNKTLDDEYVKQVLTDLKNMDMLNTRRSIKEFTLSGLGNASALMYYSPYDIFDWYVNFEQLFSDGNFDIPDKLIAWAIGDVSSNRIGYVPKFLEEDSQMYRKYLNDIGIRTQSTTLTSIASIIGVEYALKGMQPHAVSIKAAQRAFLFDVERITSTIHMIDSMYSNWGYNWTDLRLRLVYGVDDKLLDFVRLPGIGKKNAILLYEMGYTSLDELSEATVNELSAEFTKTKAQTILRNAKKIVNKRNTI